MCIILYKNTFFYHRILLSFKNHIKGIEYKIYFSPLKIKSLCRDKYKWMVDKFFHYISIVSSIGCCRMLKWKWEKSFNSFEISQYINSPFSARLLIGQNDSLDVLLLDKFFLRFKKGRNDLTKTFGCLFEKWTLIVMH